MFKKEYKGPPLWVILKARFLTRVPMKLLRWSKGMKSTAKYNLVPNDEFDTRIPLHSDAAFDYGITFQAKYIGTMDVPRPTNRVEIVAAMRRVRYEFKARGVKKRKVVIAVSTNGVRVTGYKKAGKRKPSKLFRRGSKLSTEGPEIMNHPIYRIFYVSHDSSDLKIFSYIARDGPSNMFKCNVFKSNRKNQAMKIVRTVGQAFEVCHKMKMNAIQQAPSTSSAIDEPVASDRFSDIAASKEMVSECGASESGAGSSKAVDDMLMNFQEPVRPKTLELLPPPPRKEKRSSQRTTPVPSVSLPELPECITKVELPLDSGDAMTPLSAQHQLQLFKEQLEQQAQQTQAAVAQLLLLRDQLAAEQAARCEAQARQHQLLVSNKELLKHIAELVSHLQEQERGILQPINAQQLTLLPQKKTNNGGGGPEIVKADGNQQDRTSNSLINLLSSPKVNQNLKNNNLCLSPFGTPTFPEDIEGISSAPPFGEMTNEQIQNYLESKFQHMGGFPVAPEMKNNNQQFFQNCNAFPHIPPFANQYSNADISGLLQSSGSKYCLKDERQDLAQAMSVGQSDISLFSTSQPTTSQDSSPSTDEGVPFIMPLSHNGTLTATDDDGRVRVIVPVSPSESSADVPEANGSKLQVPTALGLAPPAPITRTTSEKFPNRSEMMAEMRSQWTRHTTK